MKDLTESVIMPREDFIELSQAAWDVHPTPIGERIGTSIQTTYVMALLTGAVVAGTWGCAKAVDWLEERRLKRERDHRDLHNERPNQ